MSKLNLRQLKTDKQIRERVDQQLGKQRIQGLCHINIVPIRESSKTQISKGRPGKQTRYQTKTRTVYSMASSRSKQAFEQERRCDGAIYSKMSSS